MAILRASTVRLVSMAVEMGASDCTVIHNVVENNLSGIILYDWCSGNLVLSNLVETNDVAGIALFGADDNIVGCNVIRENVDGILLADSSFNQMSNNYLEGDPTVESMGIVAVEGSSGSDVYNNIVVNQGVSGLYLCCGAVENVAMYNTFAGNEFFGVLVEEGPNPDNVVNFNNLMDNGEMGVLNDTETELNAEYNWWGDRDPEFIDGYVEGPVDWTPWLTHEVPN